jgi:hypothetical protein
VEERFVVFARLGAPFSPIVWKWENFQVFKNRVFRRAETID